MLNQATISSLATHWHMHGRAHIHTQMQTAVRDSMQNIAEQMLPIAHKITLWTKLLMNQCCWQRNITLWTTLLKETAEKSNTKKIMVWIRLTQTGHKITLQIKSLAATSIIFVTRCVAANTSVLTKHMSVTTKHVFVKTKHVFCCDKHRLTNIYILYEYMSRQKFCCNKIFLLWQKFCHDKHTFVATKDVFCCDNNGTYGSSCQWWEPSSGQLTTTTCPCNTSKGGAGFFYCSLNMSTLSPWSATSAMSGLSRAAELSHSWQSYDCGTWSVKSQQIQISWNIIHSIKQSSFHVTFARAFCISGMGIVQRRTLWNQWGPAPPSPHSTMQSRNLPH